MTNRLDDFTAVRLERVDYPACALGITESGKAHDYEAVVDVEPPLLYCRQCGAIRLLELEEKG